MKEKNDQNQILCPSPPSQIINGSPIPNNEVIFYMFYVEVHIDQKLSIPWDHQFAIDICCCLWKLNVDAANVSQSAKKNWSIAEHSLHLVKMLKYSCYTINIMTFRKGSVHQLRWFTITPRCRHWIPFQ